MGIFKFFGRMWKRSVDTVEDAVDASGKAIETAGEYTGKAANFVGDTAMATVEMTGKAIETAGEYTGKAVNIAAEGAMATVDMTGKAMETAGEYTGKAVSFVGDSLESLVQSMFNTTKFLTSSKYRQEEGYPWIKGIVRTNWSKVKTEVNESEEMLTILWKYSQGKDISKEEAKMAKEQLFDIIKIVPALGIFALPGGAILLPLLARALPWDLMPSSFSTKMKEKYGEEALNVDLKEGEEIPTDETVQAPKDLTKRIEKEAPDLVEEAKKATQETQS